MWYYRLGDKPNNAIVHLFVIILLLLIMFLCYLEDVQLTESSQFHLNSPMVFPYYYQAETINRMKAENMKKWKDVRETLKYLIPSMNDFCSSENITNPKTTIEKLWMDLVRNKTFRFLSKHEWETIFLKIAEHEIYPTNVFLREGFLLNLKSELRMGDRKFRRIYFWLDNLIFEKHMSIKCTFIWLIRLNYLSFIAPNEFSVKIIIPVFSKTNVLNNYFILHRYETSKEIGRFTEKKLRINSLKRPKVFLVNLRQNFTSSLPKDFGYPIFYLEKYFNENERKLNFATKIILFLNKIVHTYDLVLFTNTINVTKPFYERDGTMKDMFSGIYFVYGNRNVGNFDVEMAKCLPQFSYLFKTYRYSYHEIHHIFMKDNLLLRLIMRITASFLFSSPCGTVGKLCNEKKVCLPFELMTLDVVTQFFKFNNLN
ncbi:hypothetical protein SNEBB_010327 [Seison nebaliae]|nr:hypothetical protein SNEBB_010327 [Seison nebaliae]